MLQCFHDFYGRSFARYGLGVGDIDFNETDSTLAALEKHSPVGDMRTRTNVYATHVRRQCSF